MPKKTIPVYNIKDFKDFERENGFYANSMKRHLKKHHIILTPHKHDFFLTVLFTKGSGTHEIDFTKYKVEPGAIFMLKPGQTHNWKLSEDIDGFVFFHTKHFYDSLSVSLKINDFPFFNSIYNPPLLLLKNKLKEKVEDLFSEIKKEYDDDKPLKFQKLQSLISLVYIELSRSYQPKKIIQSETYLLKLKQLEELIELHFKELKYPYQYADKMAISEKHLNRIIKKSLNKTTGGLIADRIILEAQNLLTHSALPITQIAEELGYHDNSYFSRFFKKRTGFSPLTFTQANRH